jgi:hypothetical protein
MNQNIVICAVINRYSTLVTSVAAFRLWRYGIFGAELQILNNKYKVTTKHNIAMNKILLWIQTKNQNQI